MFTDFHIIAWCCISVFYTIDTVSDVCCCQAWIIDSCRWHSQTWPDIAHEEPINRNFVCLALAPTYASSEIDILARVFPMISRESLWDVYESMIGFLQLVSSDEVSSDDVSNQAVSFWGWKTQRQVYPSCTWIAGMAARNFGSKGILCQIWTWLYIDLHIVWQFWRCILRGVNEVTFQAYLVVKRQIKTHALKRTNDCVPRKWPGLEELLLVLYQDRKEETWWLDGCTWTHVCRTQPLALLEDQVGDRPPVPMTSMEAGFQSVGGSVKVLVALAFVTSIFLTCEAARCVSVCLCVWPRCIYDCLKWKEFEEKFLAILVYLSVALDFDCLGLQFITAGLAQKIAGNSAIVRSLIWSSKLTPKRPTDPTNHKDDPSFWPGDASFEGWVLSNLGTRKGGKATAAPSTQQYTVSILL